MSLAAHKEGKGIFLLSSQMCALSDKLTPVLRAAIEKEVPFSATRGSATPMMSRVTLPKALGKRMVKAVVVSKGTGGGNRGVSTTNARTLHQALNSTL